MNEPMGQFADFFPEIKNYTQCKDPRVFETKWERYDKEAKKKTYFCCIVGGTCFGVDVIKPYWDDATLKKKAAYAQVRHAADYYVEHGTWPSDSQ